MTHKPKILIVDDEKPNLDILVGLFGPHYIVSVAKSGEQAIALATGAARPDVILLDVMMPGVDGWEMLRRMQERHGMGSIPVIMFSGQVDDDATDQAEASGAQAFVGKPFNPQELVTRAKDLLGS